MRRLVLTSLCATLLVLPALAAPPKSDRDQKLTNDPWKGVSTAPLTAAEIDQLIAAEQAAAKVKPAPRTTDEQFLRRVMLDLTGKMPTPAEIKSFAADKDQAKRARLIDKLLAGDDYAEHWARYWRDVFTARVPDNRGRQMARAFEDWLLEQFRQNRPWDRIARAMITAEGKIPLRYGRPGADEKEKPDGASYFLLSYQGRDAINDRTAETARIFLGIQIQCAQCHDHPFDGWKQEQFHELASYFARCGERPVFEMVNGRRQLTGYQVVSRPAGEHRMPDRDDPRRGKVMSPRFLDGSALSSRSDDEQRRRTLADAMTKDNYWFAAAFVNRTWGVLMGQAFCQPVDDLSPGKDVVMAPVLARLAAGFKGSGYDIKELLRVLCNTETYQRQVRPGESGEGHGQFAGAYPARLPAESLWHALTSVLGPMNQGPTGRPRPMPPGPLAGRAGLEGQFKEEFRFDPSLPPDDVEASIPQALLLMNNPQIQQRLRADGPTMLNRLLRDHPRDDEAVQALYLRVLARKPTDRERAKALAYVKKVGRRGEAFEDLLWALLNSTEFQTKR